MPFRRAWLAAEGNLSASGLAGLVGSEFKKGCIIYYTMVGSLKMNTTLEYSTRVVQEGDRRCKKSTLNDLAHLTPLRIPLMNPVLVFY